MKLYEIVCHFRPLIISLVVCTNTFLILTFKFLLLMLQFLLTFGLWADNMLYFLSLLIEISDLLSDLDASTQKPVVWVFCADLLSYYLYKVFTDILLNLRTFENKECNCRGLSRLQIFIQGLDLLQLAMLLFLGLTLISKCLLLLLFLYVVIFMEVSYGQ